MRRLTESRFTPLRFLCVLCASAVKKICLLLLLLSSWFAPPTVKAQTGEITGRVVYEDGGGAPNTTVTLASVNSSQRPASARPPADKAITDADGKFKFTGLRPGVYVINVFGSKGYVRAPAAEMLEQSRYRVGDSVTITMIRGGVITGRVTTADGEPMVGVRVHPVMVRDAEGHPVRQQSGNRPRLTDDRGVYRLYGLAPGTYVIYMRSESFVAPASLYEGDVATYHPASTHDTAAEITVVSGVEATGVDIRHRGMRGRVVSGTVTGITGALSLYNYAQVLLTSLSTGQVLTISGVRPGENTNVFAIYGVPDGDYEINAQRIDTNSVEVLTSSPRRVTVKGADVTGIELRLAPMASISGKFLLETAQNACENKRKSTVEEVAMAARRDDGAGVAVDPSGLLQQDGSVGAKGDFSIYNLQAGRYFIEPKLPNENWFVKSIAANLPSSAAANAKGAASPPASNDIARNGVTLKSGEKLTGVTLTVSDGGASLRGKVVSEAAGARLPSRLRIHLIPAETTARDDVSRYAEAFVQSEGTFALNNIAPGRYWLIARAAPDDEPGDRPPARDAWHANERAKLRREGEAMKVEVDLKPCQRVTEQVVKFER